LMIVVEDRGPRHLMLVDPSLDESLTTVRLNDTDASVVAPLLTGTRFHIELPEDEAWAARRAECQLHQVGHHRRSGTDWQAGAAAVPG
jgi:hypothetical protein